MKKLSPKLEAELVEFHRDPKLVSDFARDMAAMEAAMATGAYREGPSRK